MAELYREFVTEESDDGGDDGGEAACSGSRYVYR